MKRNGLAVLMVGLFCALSAHADAMGDALIEAAKTNNAAEVRRLIASGADVNAMSLYGGTALMSAAWTNAVDAAKLLIASGANINAKDNNGITALMWAVACGSEDVVDVLLNAVGAR